MTRRLLTTLATGICLMTPTLCAQEATPAPTEQVAKPLSANDYILVMDKNIACISELCDILSPVGDLASADNAAPKVEALARKVRPVFEELAALPSPADEIAKTLERHYSKGESLDDLQMEAHGYLQSIRTSEQPYYGSKELEKAMRYFEDQTDFDTIKIDDTVFTPYLALADEMLGQAKKLKKVLATVKNEQTAGAAVEQSREIINTLQELEDQISLRSTMSVAAGFQLHRKLGRKGLWDNMAELEDDVDRLMVMDPPCFGCQELEVILGEYFNYSEDTVDMYDDEEQ